MKSVLDFSKYKHQNRKITIMTCYDYHSACLLEQSNIDCILVGDSLGMVMHGFKNTTSVDIDLMAIHTRAVSNGISNKFIISDLPFLSYRKSIEITMNSVERLIQSGAQAVKLEHVDGNEKSIRHIVESGIPVMGHIGLTAQLVNSLGGYKVQGKNNKAHQALLDQAKRLEDAGCFSIVLECMPSSVAQDITENLTIPTIGIGAGCETDGQVLVYHDALGLQNELQPKFVKKFMDGKSLAQNAINQYVQDVQNKVYPADEHCY